MMTLKAQTYAPDGYIVREGELGKEIYFISRGKAEITSDEGREIHGTFEAGDYFGHLSLVLEEKSTASVRTLTYCGIFILTNDDLDRIREEYPEFRDVLEKMSQALLGLHISPPPCRRPVLPEIAPTRKTAGQPQHKRRKCTWFTHARL